MGRAEPNSAARGNGVSVLNLDSIDVKNTMMHNANWDLGKKKSKKGKNVNQAKTITGKYPIKHPTNTQNALKESGGLDSECEIKADIVTETTLIIENSESVDPVESSSEYTPGRADTNTISSCKIHRAANKLSSISLSDMELKLGSNLYDDRGAPIQSRKRQYYNIEPKPEPSIKK